MDIEFTGVGILILSIFVLYLGQFLTRRIALLENNNIPPAVTGGLICSVIVLLLHTFSDLSITFEFSTDAGAVRAKCRRCPTTASPQAFRSQGSGPGPREQANSRSGRRGGPHGKRLDGGAVTLARGPTADRGEYAARPFGARPAAATLQQPLPTTGSLLVD